jgi:hypothetical protein
MWIIAAIGVVVLAVFNARHEKRMAQAIRNHLTKAIG